MSRRFFGQGKVLLSGEYVVLDGALSLALPVIFGQELVVDAPSSNPGLLTWQSYNNKGQIWFSGQWELDTLQVLNTSEKAVADRLTQMLKAAKSLNQSFLEGPHSYQVKTKLTFHEKWGFGSSSTLLHSLAQWARVNPFVLSAQTLGGSGYDIACAGAKGPIFYQLQGNTPMVRSTAFKPDFHRHLLFVYLGKKQNSREGIQRYRLRFKKPDTKLLEAISTISENLAKAKTLAEFMILLDRHETLISQAIQLPKVKEKIFPEFAGSIKSLGAWGGDFILAAANEIDMAKQYFTQKGYTTIFPYEDLILIRTNS